MVKLCSRFAVETTWLSLLSALLAFVPLLFLLYGAVLIDTEPDVGVRPGVKSVVATDGYTPVTDCGGTSLHIIFRGARVVADASQQARAAEAPAGGSRGSRWPAASSCSC